jgi:hypothetical protein
MKLVKAGALALVALAFPASAQAHHATVSVSCSEAVISYAAFPHGTNTVHYVVKVDDTVAAEDDYTFSGSTGTKHVPLTIHGNHTVAVSTSWNTNGVIGDDAAQKAVSCDEAPPPPATPPASGSAPSAPAPAPAAAAPVPASGVQAERVDSRAVAPTRAVLGTRSSCASRTIRATVRGRGMRRVTFSVNGRVVRTITVRGRRTIRATLRRSGTGPQAVTVRVRYANRTEVLTARANRCAQAQVQPEFTG